MGWGFRRSLKLGPLKLNFSKSGVGYSIGGRGFRVGQDARGRSYTSASIPGTGLYSRQYSSQAQTPAALPPGGASQGAATQDGQGRGLALLLLFGAGILVGVALTLALARAPAPPPAPLPAPAPQAVTPAPPTSHHAAKKRSHPPRAGDSGPAGAQAVPHP